MSVLDHLPIIGAWRQRRMLIDAEAISLIHSSKDDETAYQAARQLMRLAREDGDRQAATLYAMVAVTIASVTGRAVGKGISPRDAVPSHAIDGNRIVPTVAPQDKN